MPNAIHQMINEEAGRASVDVNLAMAIAAQESGFNPHMGNSRSSAFGVYQFIDDNWRDYGIDPRSPITRDPQTQVRLGVDRIRQNRDGLSVFLGRSPEHSEVYLAHVFGLRGSQLILGASDDTPLASVRPPEVFAANPWIAQNGLLTVGQMRAWMRNTTDRHLAEVSGLIDPNATATPWGDPSNFPNGGLLTSPKFRECQ